MGSVCMFLLADNVGHLFICLVGSWISSITGSAGFSERG